MERIKNVFIHENNSLEYFENAPEFKFVRTETKCIFFNMNETYPIVLERCANIQDNYEKAMEVYENIRGCWDCIEKKRDEADYAVAMYKSVCVGIFKIDGWKGVLDDDKSFPKRYDRDSYLKMLKYDKYSTFVAQDIQLVEKYFGNSNKDHSHAFDLKKKNNYFFTNPPIIYENEYDGHINLDMLGRKIKYIYDANNNIVKDIGERTEFIYSW